VIAKKLLSLFLLQVCLLGNLWSAVPPKKRFLEGNLGATNCCVPKKQKTEEQKSPLKTQEEKEVGNFIEYLGTATGGLVDDTGTFNKQALASLLMHVQTQALLTFFITMFSRCDGEDQQCLLENPKCYKIFITKDGILKRKKKRAASTFNLPLLSTLQNLNMISFIINHFKKDEELNDMPTCYFYLKLCLYPLLSTSCILATFSSHLVLSEEELQAIDFLRFQCSQNSGIINFEGVPYLVFESKFGKMKKLVDHLLLANYKMLTGLIYVLKYFYPYKEQNKEYGILLRDVMARGGMKEMAKFIEINEAFLFDYDGWNKCEGLTLEQLRMKEKWLLEKILEKRQELLNKKYKLKEQCFLQNYPYEKSCFIIENVVLGEISSLLDILNDTFVVGNKQDLSSFEFYKHCYLSLFLMFNQM